MRPTVTVEQRAHLDSWRRPMALTSMRPASALMLDPVQVGVGQQPAQAP